MPEGLRNTLLKAGFRGWVGIQALTLHLAGSLLLTGLLIAGFLALRAPPCMAATQRIPGDRYDLPAIASAHPGHRRPTEVEAGEPFLHRQLSEPLMGEIDAWAHAASPRKDLPARKSVDEASQLLALPARGLGFLVGIRIITPSGVAGIVTWILSVDAG